MKYLYMTCISLQCLLAIGQVQYSKNLDFAPGSFDLLNNIVPLEDGFAILTRGIELSVDSLLKQKGVIARINEFGIIDWKEDVIINEDIYLIAQNGHLLKKDECLYGILGKSGINSGFIVFKISKLGENYSFRDFQLMTSTSDPDGIINIGNYLVIALDIEFKRHKILVLDCDLNTVKEIDLDFDMTFIPETGSIMSIKYNHFIHSFSYLDNQNFTWLKIREYDLDLNIVREFDGLKTNEFLSDVVTIPTEDNGFMVAWNKDVSHTLYDTFPYPSAIFKLDSMFNVEWEYVFVHRGAKQFLNFRYAGDGKYLGCGASDFLSVTDHDPNPEWDYNAWAFLINEDGTLDWEKQIYDTRYTHSNAFFDGIKTDFGYAFVGKLDTIKETPSPYLNDPDGWYFTLDENGCWNGNCNEFIFIDSDSTSFTLVSTEEPLANKSLKAYPNPSNGVVTIEHEGSSERRLVVYDISGNKIMDQILYAKRSIIDLSDMPNATYILNVLNSKGEIIENQKIIIQH